MSTHSRKARLARDLGESTQSAPEPLSRSQLRELRRRIRDVEDRTRYLLVSAFTRRFVLYYDVSNDTFAMNAPSSGTLFKRRTAAIAIQRLLRPGVEVVRCRADRRGRVVKSSVPHVRPNWRRRIARNRLRSANVERHA